MPIPDRRPRSAPRPASNRRARGAAANDEAARQFTRDLEAAEALRDPWHRGQALAELAYQAPDGRARERVLQRSFRAACELQQPNRAVTVSAWPLEALAHTASAGRLTNEVERLVEILRAEPNPLRRADALAQMIWALRAGPLQILWQVLGLFHTTCRAGYGWRIDRALSGVAAMVDTLDHKRALDLVESIRNPRMKRRALPRIGEAPAAAPRTAAASSGSTNDDAVNRQ